jgi:hypothetical protein
MFKGMNICDENSVTTSRTTTSLQHGTQFAFISNPYTTTTTSKSKPMNQGFKARLAQYNSILKMS